MRNYKFEISYDGTKYNGWEKKSNGITIQGKLESVLCEMTGASVEVIGCGRTDAGVHAEAMIANAHMDTDKSEDEILSYMNHYLPSDISVNQITIVPDLFHARYNAKGKTYTYTCFVGPKKPIFDRKYITVLDYAPDIEKMRSAAICLLGSHDFTSFCTKGSKKKSPVRVIYSLDIKREGDYIYFYVHGSGFLYNMVRIIVGTLLQVGHGEIPPESVEQILLSRDRQKAGPTVPAQGLCLTSVDYS